MSFESGASTNDKGPGEKSILSALTDSKTAKLARTLGTAAALVMAVPGAVSETQAAGKDRPVAAEKLKQKKAPESAKKASPADQLRERRQRVEQEAARMLEEKRLLGELEKHNVPQELLDKVRNAKSGRDLEYIPYEDTYKKLNEGQKLGILEFINSTRLATDSRTIEGAFSGLRGLPPSDQARNLALKIVLNMRWQDEKDPNVVVLGKDRHLFAAQKFIEYVLDRDLSRVHRDADIERNARWLNTMLQGMARNIPREKLMYEVVVPLGKYLHYLHSDFDVAKLIRDSYKRQSLTEMGKVFSDKTANRDTEKYEARFIRSDYWKYLLPEEKIEFLRKHDSRHSPDLIAAIMRERRDLSIYSSSTYVTVLDELVKNNADAVLRAFVTEQLSMGREDIPAIRKALLDSATTGRSRLNFAKEHLWSQYTEEQRELMRLLRPEELLIIRGRNPNLWNALDDPGLKNIAQVKKEYLPKKIQELALTEVAQWQTMVVRNLYFQNIPANPDAVRKEVERIQLFREKYNSYPLFGNTLVGAHEELLPTTTVKTPRFGKSALIDGIRAHTPNVRLISPHVNPQAGDYRATPESLQEARRQIIDGIINSPASASLHFTFLADMHGGGGGTGAIYLSDGIVEGTIQNNKEGNPEPVRETRRTVKITTEELADAFIKRYQDNQKRVAAAKNPDVLILAACYSSNIARYFAESLKKAGVPIPIIIGMAEYGQLGYSKFSSAPGSDFLENTILQLKGNKSPTIGGVIEYDQRQEDSDPILLVPDDNGNYMQLSDAEWFARVNTDTA